MRYMSYHQCDVLNGEGIRNTLFVSGCVHKCVGCHNPETFSPRNGQDYTPEFTDYIIETCQVDYISGLTLSGGDPMFQDNRPEILNLVRRFKDALPDKNLWLWSGYTFDQMMQDPQMSKILPYLDVVVDGPYMQELRNLNLAWRGSENQNVIDVQATLQQYITTKQPVLLH